MVYLFTLLEFYFEVKRLNAYSYLQWLCQNCASLNICHFCTYYLNFLVLLFLLHFADGWMDRKRYRESALLTQVVDSWQSWGKLNILYIFTDILVSDLLVFSSAPTWPSSHQRQPGDRSRETVPTGPLLASYTRHRLCLPEVSQVCVSVNNLDISSWIINNI